MSAPMPRDENMSTAVLPPFSPDTQVTVMPSWLAIIIAVAAIALTWSNPPSEWKTCLELAVGFLLLWSAKREQRNRRR